MKIGINQKQYAQSYSSIFSENPRIFGYSNELKNKEIDILKVQYYDFTDIIFYSTIGLSNHDLGITSNGKDLRIEIISAFYKDFDEASNLISNCAFHIIDNKSLSPNLIIPNIAREHFKTDLTDLWITFPNLLDKSNITYEYEDYYITVLQMIPISASESMIVLSKGGNELHNLFVMNNIDQFDIKRKSINK